MSNSACGQLVVISGPSGVGKSTVVRELLRSCPLPLRLSVSATTRPARPGEIDGVAYHFLKTDEFERRRALGQFLECFEVHGVGYWYGTLESEVKGGLAEGKIVILEIDVHGARQVRAKFPRILSIFIRPATMEDLEKRLRGRGTESEERIQRRLATAQEEMQEASDYDHEVINIAVADAVAEICGILRNSMSKNP